MLWAAPRFRTTVASGSMIVALLVVGEPVGAAGGDGAESAQLAAVEAVLQTRLAWLKQPDTWQLRWSRPLVAQASVPAAGLVAWLDAGAVHGVRVADGLPAWRRVPAGDTLLFPRSALPLDRVLRSGAISPAAINSVGHLLYAVIDAGRLGPLLVCLDCSDTAEGRLLWSASPPVNCVAFDGPPVADDRLCVVVVRGSDDRSPLEVVAHDARDGLVVWRRPLATAFARDGIDHARGRRQATFAEGLVVMADHAGSVWAIDRDGRPAWRHAYELSPDAGERLPAVDCWPTVAAPVVAAREGLAVAARDRGGLMMLDPVPQPPQLRWETAGSDCLRIVGVADAGVVVEDHTAARVGDIAVYDSITGRITAGREAATNGRGPAVMAGGVILQPGAEDVAGRQRLAITAIDAASLQPLGKSYSFSPADSGPETVDAPQPQVISLAVTPTAMIVASSSQLVSLGPAP
jgi:outer membrane protein assembly factor BamB